MIHLPHSLKRLFGDSNTRRIPVQARHVELSAIISADDEPATPSDKLLDLALLSLSWIKEFPRIYRLIRGDHQFSGGRAQLLKEAQQHSG